MRIKCLHGYFLFSETKQGQASDFVSANGADLIARDDYFTFSDLAEAPEYSIRGKAFLDFTAIITFEGKPWEVFEANGVVYDFVNGILVPIESIVQPVSLVQSGNLYISPGLILPGSITDDGLRVTDYSAWYSHDLRRWYYSEVTRG